MRLTSARTQLVATAFRSNMVDKSTYEVSVLVSMLEAKATLVEEGGVPVLVEIMEVGSHR